MYSFQPSMTQRSLFKKRKILDSIRQINNQDNQENQDVSILEPSISYVLRDFNIAKQQEANRKWKGNSFRVLFHISQFIRQLKLSVIKLKFRFVTARILNIINDLASDPKNILKSRNNTKFQLLNNLRNCLPIIEPDSKFKLIWDIIILFQVLMSQFYIPLYLTFEFKEGSIMEYVFDIIPSWFMLIDVIIKCQTAYYKEGVIYRTGIMKNYADTNLLTDLIIVIPAILIGLGLQQLKFLLLLRGLYLSNMVEQIEERINLKEYHANIFQLIKLAFFIMIICHYCACAWAYIGIYQNKQGLYCWLAEYELKDVEWSSVYINSLYFSAITTLTIGYGDITPKTDFEKIYVVIVALLVCGVLGYSISTIGNIFKSMTEKQDQFKTKMKILVRYMRSRSLSPSIQLEVRKFYEHISKQEREYNNEAEEMMKLLSKDLQQKIAIDTYYQTLKQSRLLQNLSDSCLRQLCSHIKEAKSIPQDIIFNRNETVSKLIFVLKGELCLMANDQVIKQYKDGCLAEREFLLQTTLFTQLKASNFCQFAYLTYEDFYNTIRDNTEDFEKLHMIKDNILHNQANKNFGQVCEICQWTHQITSCPYVFVTINRMKLMKQIKLSKEQQRLYIERRGFRFQSKKSKLELQEDALALIVNAGLIPFQELNDQSLKDLGFQINNDFAVEKKSICKLDSLNPTPKNFDSLNPTSRHFDSSLVNQLFNRTRSISKQIRKKSDSDHSIQRGKHYQNPKILENFTDSSISSQEEKQQKVKFNKDGQVLLPLQLQQNSSHFNSEQSKDQIPQLRIESIKSINNQGQKAKRFSLLRLGSRQNSVKIESLNMIQQLEQDQIQHTQFLSFDIDKQQLMNVYYTNNNYDQVFNRMIKRRSGVRGELLNKRYKSLFAHQ